MKRIKAVFLALSVVFLAISLWLLHTNNQGQHQGLYQQIITESLQREVREASTLFSEFAEVFGKNSHVRFSELNIDSKYPIFMFRNGQLVYWSDYRYQVPYDAVKGFYRGKAVELDKNIFIVLRNSIPNRSEYEVFTLIPLYIDFRQEGQRFNTAIFPSQEVKIGLSAQAGSPIFSRHDEYYFSLNFPRSFTFLTNGMRSAILVLDLMAMLFFSLFLLKTVVDYLQQDRGVSAFAALAVGMLVGRATMLYCCWPLSLYDSTVFRPEIFAASQINPSLGDLFLNMACLAILGIFCLVHLKEIGQELSRFYLPEKMRWPLAVLLVFGSFFAAFLLTYTVNLLYTHSSINLDITTEFQFGLAKILALLLLVFGLVVYFSYCHLASKWLRMLEPSPQGFMLLFAIGALLFSVVSLLSNLGGLFNYVNLVYFGLITYFNFTISFKRAENRTFLYLFTSAFAGALIMAYAIHDYSQERESLKKARFANNLLHINDPESEFKFHEIVRRLSEDDTLKNQFSRLLEPEVVRTHVRRNYITALDRYELSIFMFDSSGENLEPGTAFPFLPDPAADAQMQPTEFPDIYFIDDLVSGSIQYRCFVPINASEAQEPLGYLLLAFRLKKVLQNPNTFYPPLTVFDGQGAPTGQPNGNFSYAVYRYKNLVYSYGDFSYADTLPAQYETGPGAAQTNITTASHQHYLAEGQEGLNVVISSPLFPIKSIWTNIAFLFLLLIFLVMVIIFFISNASQYRRERINFSTRIQLFMNMALFLPLIAVSVVTISILGTGSQAEMESYFLERGEAVSINIAEEMQHYVTGKISLEELEDVVNQVAKLTQMTVNLYDRAGKLVTASEGILFEQGLMSEWINPRAFAAVMENYLSKTMLNESIGDLFYNSAYVSVKSPESGEILGIVSTPFYLSKKRVEQQVIAVISTVLLVFSVMLVLLLISSFFSAKELTRPLDMLTQKIKKLSLSGNNERIEYNSEDEIGLLVGEYNRMIKKLEESRTALARSEKESAWREMAKQVAHEIKNPLNPMKLTLQQLQRVLGDDNPRIKKSLKILLDQVETLNDITTSFSSFAKMPLPQEQRFELTDLLQEVISLHRNSRKARITAEMPEGPCFILGDPSLMSRVFTNLILNGIQAVPPGREPHIHVSLTPFTPNRVLMEFRDNGVGIPEEIRNKVFSVNFSTKTNGSGIGLAVAKRGIEHLGGNIWFETVAHQGTAFFIEMPISVN